MSYAFVFAPPRLVNHVLHYSEFLDPNFFPGFLKAIVPPGHINVLVFFLLSGYVIEISNSGARELTIATTGNYLKKRFVRLYPIYILVLCFTLLIAVSTYSTTTIAGNFLFLQHLVVPRIVEIDPSWSLNYEVIFYLAFIPLSLLRINPIWLAGMLFGAAMISFVGGFRGSEAIASYSVGFMFWLSGLAIARYLRQSHRTNYRAMISNLCLLLALPAMCDNSILYFGGRLANSAYDFASSYRVAFGNLLLLPYCIMFIIQFSGRSFPYRRRIFACLQLLPLISLYPLYLLIKEGHYSVLFSIGMYVISCLLFFVPVNFSEKFGMRIFRPAIWLGSISYAVYLLHFPLLVLFGRVNTFSGSILTYGLRLVLFFSLLIGVSWLLEKRLQPLLRDKLMGSRGKAKLNKSNGAVANTVNTVTQ
ncbi:MAG: acyltransferase [Pedobacter sp.]|nr:MAG: acyltransferase [Pedobacter sp.]